ncbi:hypothetical protein HMPREF0636_0128 [Porphyromonas catoniae ATCC 51270]|uniref:Uncharacterized protein n=1 Tax=Porphyromonas catoniae ATCC 51270 TaxID=887901 RepID=Z4WNY2_9PORP|nr:hypothetical protein HMPREF0636_0128 [Porphyromonas catoniae ATCC 51270]
MYGRHSLYPSSTTLFIRPKSYFPTSERRMLVLCKIDG